MTADQPEAQPETAGQIRHLNTAGTGAVLPLSHQHLYACSGGPDCYLPKHDCSAARAAGFREGAAEGAAQYRDKVLDRIDRHWPNLLAAPPEVAIIRREVEDAAGYEAREPGISAERLAKAWIITEAWAADRTLLVQRGSDDYIAHLVAEYARLGTEPTDDRT